MMIGKSSPGVFLVVSSLVGVVAIVEAFNHCASPSRQRIFQQHKDDTGISATQLRAATSFEEDLALTLQIILDHDKRSTTVSKEQFIQQMENVAATEDLVEESDVSVPYDAAARLAYSLIEDKENTSFETFELQYLEEAVAMVKSKQPKISEAKDDAVVHLLDVSVPYDAAARLAYSLFEDNQNIAFEAFEAKYLKDTVAMVKSKQTMKEGGDAPAPLSAASTDTTTTTEDVTISEAQPTTTEGKSLLQPIVSYLWNKVLPITKKFSKA